jgi:Touch receptor neuron protein Mec-17.
LKSIITTYSRFIASGDNRIYLKVEGKKVYGLLKVGKKNLFYYDTSGKPKELRPLCVLDFYVHESVQRMGIGRV